MFRKITIRTNILTNFLAVVGLIALSLFGLQYYFSHQMALSATHKTFQQITDKVTMHFQNSDQLAKEMLYHTELYLGITDPVTVRLPLETARRYAHNMQNNSSIYAIYVGHENGDFFEVVNMLSSPDLYTIYKAPQACRWLAIRVYESAEGRIRRFDYLDAAFITLLSRSEASDFRADLRPWYRQALQTDKAVRSDPYLFSNLGQKGITFSKRIGNGRQVLAVDFTLTKVDALLKQQLFAPTSRIYMFGRDGSVIASSFGGRAVNDALSRAVETGETEKVFSFVQDGKEVFGMVTTLSKELGSDTYLGFTVEADVMLKPYIEKIFYSLATALFVILLSIPVVLFTTGRIVEPIRKLMLENEKIKKRRFDEVSPVKSNIIELSELSDSLVSMSESIRAYQEAQKELMESFIRLIADAIDAKSPYTGGHCRRVPAIATMLVKAADEANEGSFKEFSFNSREEWEEFEMGAWLHDCGKITTPEYVVDKASKLETIYNRIHEVRTRFEVLWRDIEIAGYERREKGEEESAVQAWIEKERKALLDDFAFIADANIGGESMSEEKREKVRMIGKRSWLRHFDDRAGLSDDELIRYEGVERRPLPAIEQLLSDRPEHLVARVGFDEEDYKKQGFKLEVPEYLYNYGEIYNLCIEKGTLTEEERFKIDEHVIMSIRMLEQLPYPEHMRRIPEYAGTHHETMIGDGYPRRLTKAELSVPARIMAIADIFEALTATDRPYKKGKTLSETISIMGLMVKEGHIDGELFALFLRSGIHIRYAREHLEPEQIDEVDIEQYLREIPFSER